MSVVGRFIFLPFNILCWGCLPSGAVAFVDAFSSTHPPCTRRVACAGQFRHEIISEPILALAEWSQNRHCRNARARLSKWTSLFSTLVSEIDNKRTIESKPLDDNPEPGEDDGDSVNVVLVTGFESFNRDLYEKAGALLPSECKINLKGAVLFIFNPF